MPSKFSQQKRKVIGFFFNAPDRESDEFKIGALQYARPSKNWAFVHVGRNDIMAQLPRSDGFYAGGIGEFGTSKLWEAARKAPFPVVNLYGGRGFGGLSTVGVDDRAIGRMAAQHLMGQGLRHFGYFGLGDIGFSLGRRSGFTVELRRRGFAVHPFRHRTVYPVKRKFAPTYVPWEDALVGWLLSLPKPCGVFCCDDMRAEWLTVVCQNIGLQVPEDISILGVDDNPVYCESASPPLSSVHMPARQVGYEAARLLGEMLESGRPLAPPRILLPPTAVQARASTDLLAVSNPQLVKALAYIRAHARSGKLRVDDVVARTSYCRRMLETKFREEFGRTIFQEIRRLQIAHSQQLLRDTSHTMEAIAEEAGWGSASHFGVEFKKITGMSPGEYRKKMR